MTLKCGENTLGIFCRIISDVSEHGGRSSAGRAPGCGPGCRGFEPRRSPHIINYYWLTLNT